MLFNSFDFAIFFFLVVAVYFQLGHRLQNVFLLGASYVFYGWWNWRYLALLLFSSTIDYLAGLSISRSNRPRVRRTWLLVTVTFNLSLLIVFKYFNFFAASLGALLENLGVRASLPVLQLLLPIGISFITFQSMGYCIDVYRGKCKAATSYLDYLLFVSFFPQLIAGPIQRADHLMSQIVRPRSPGPQDISSGVFLMLWGLFKKVAVADGLATYVDAVYANSGEHSGMTLGFATWMFAFQIYCDFSGYSDMAIGMARILGFHLAENFRSPYLSTSMREFWARWHISLSTWFRDYVYLPLGGSRSSRGRTVLNLMVVFVISGLWHGANWTYVVWGLLHGLFVASERALNLDGRSQPPVTGIRSWLRRAVVFNLVALAWVFFRASSVAQATEVLGAIVMRSGPLFTTLVLVNALVCLLVVLVVEVLKEPDDLHPWVIGRSANVRIATASGVVLMLLLFGAQQNSQFIYFQF